MHEEFLQRFKKYQEDWYAQDKRIVEFRRRWYSWGILYLFTGFYEFWLIHQLGKITKEYEKYLAMNKPVSNSENAK